LRKTLWQLQLCPDPGRGACRAYNIRLQAAITISDINKTGLTRTHMKDHVLKNMDKDEELQGFTI